jgi:hypothetical protein
MTATARVCGCDTFEDHVEPHTDPVLGIEHGERSTLNEDPEPIEVPGSAGPHSWSSPEAYCLCGHPIYATCAALPEGGVMGLTISRGPGWTEGGGGGDGP